MDRKIRWGIIGCGKIAGKFAGDLGHVVDAELLAVASRSAEKAGEFASRFGVARAYGSYGELLADGDVDAVYIATPHVFHEENAIACANAGKAVLCEKPFAMNACQGRRMVEAARANGTFMMEAMWTRFIPLTIKIRQMLADGVIGEVRMLTADFGYAGEWSDESRVLNPHLGGGALLDVGVYAISFVSMVFGSQPDEIAAVAKFASSGVDEMSAFLFRYEHGAIANLSCAVTAKTPGEAVIMGTKGYIRILNPFWHGTKAIITRPDQADETIEVPYNGNGLHYQAAEVNRQIMAGQLESGGMALDETLDIMETMDEVRRKLKLRYPGEM